MLLLDELVQRPHSPLSRWISFAILAAILFFVFKAGQWYEGSRNRKRNNQP